MKDKLTLKKIFNFEIITILVILIVITVLSVFMVDVPINTNEDLINWYKINYIDILGIELFFFIIVNFIGFINVTEKGIKDFMTKAKIKSMNIEGEYTVDRPNYSLVIIDALLYRNLEASLIKQSIEENIKNEIPSYMNIDADDELYQKLIKIDLNNDDNENVMEFENELYTTMLNLGFVKYEPTILRLIHLNETKNRVYFGIILVLLFVLFMGGITAFGIIPIIAYLVFTAQKLTLSKTGELEAMKIKIYNDYEKERI